MVQPSARGWTWMCGSLVPSFGLGHLDLIKREAGYRLQWAVQGSLHGFWWKWSDEGIEWMGLMSWYHQCCLCKVQTHSSYWIMRFSSEDNRCRVKPKGLGNEDEIGWYLGASMSGGWIWMCRSLPPSFRWRDLNLTMGGGDYNNDCQRLYKGLYKSYHWNGVMKALNGCDWLTEFNDGLGWSPEIVVAAMVFIFQKR